MAGMGGEADNWVGKLEGVSDDGKAWLALAEGAGVVRRKLDGFGAWVTETGESIDCSHDWYTKMLPT